MDPFSCLHNRGTPVHVRQVRDGKNWPAVACRSRCDFHPATPTGGDRHPPQLGLNCEDSLRGVKNRIASNGSRLKACADESSQSPGKSNTATALWPPMPEAIFQT